MAEPDRGADTILALASGRGRAGVAVIRVSGPGTRAVLTRLAGAVPAPRRASLRTLRDAAGGALDQALVLYFPGPASFTGEDVAEFQVHGGPAVIAAVSAAALTVEGVRLAEPGEFTRRAVMAGRMDLTGAEGLADLVDAETEGQRRQALRQMEGGLGRQCAAWRAGVIRCLALAEAEIDFPDEDLPEDLTARLAPEIGALRAEIEAVLAQAGRGERMRSGVSIAIVGPPNVGKSSILNWLAGREAAIVSARAGTTRDVIEVGLDLGGVPVVLADTAGLRVSEDEIEREGIARARAAAAAADLVVSVLGPDATGMAAEGEALALAVWNKADVSAPPPGFEGMVVSARTGLGMDGLVAALTREAERLAGLTEAPGVTRARHRVALGDAVEHLSRALGVLDQPDLAAEDLRLAARAIGRVTGAVDVDEILDVVFGEFCIGK